jgi:hypothetical protein
MYALQLDIHVQRHRPTLQHRTKPQTQTHTHPPSSLLPPLSNPHHIPLPSPRTTPCPSTGTGASSSRIRELSSSSSPPCWPPAPPFLDARGK